MVTSEDFKADFKLINTELKLKITSIMVDLEAISLPLKDNKIFERIERNTATDEVFLVEEKDSKIPLDQTTTFSKIAILEELEKMQ